jgi:cation/acetate symporter
MFPTADFQWFPLSNPGIVSIPLGFLLGFLGTITSRVKEDPGVAAEMDVRSLTGYGAEGATKH